MQDLCNEFIWGARMLGMGGAANCRSAEPVCKVPSKTQGTFPEKGTFCPRGTYEQETTYKKMVFTRLFLKSINIYLIFQLWAS
jgi:hypothetical protein